MDILKDRKITFLVRDAKLLRAYEVERGRDGVENRVRAWEFATSFILYVEHFDHAPVQDSVHFTFRRFPFNFDRLSVLVAQILLG